MSAADVEVIRATASTTPVLKALAAATDALAAAGVDSPRLDAELLLAEATGWDRARLAAEPERSLPPGASRAMGGMVRRRLRREPVAYILGRKGFRNIELAVDARVLVPRPETELLVEVALDIQPDVVLDIGTGSGAVALAIADELPEATGIATDISDAALDVANANAERLGLRERMRFVKGTLAAGAEALEADLLVANLPYVSESQWERLAPEIREFEPREGLVAGPTGLEAIEALLVELEGAEEIPPAIALEVGAGQAPAVAEMARTAGYSDVQTRPDLGGVERVVVGRG